LAVSSICRNFAKTNYVPPNIIRW